MKHFNTTFTLYLYTHFTIKILILIHILLVKNINYLRSACSIPDPSSGTVLVTGGSNTMTMVSRYSRAGWVADLPPLSVGRYNHACGGYVSDGELVSTVVKVGIVV